MTALPRKEESRIFICYAKQDEEMALNLFDQLQSYGYIAWLDKRSLELGDDWEIEIKNAVSEADAVVVLLRPEFDEIGYRQKEVRWALEAMERHPIGRGFIIPFIVVPCDLPVWCCRLHAGSDLEQPTKFADLVAALEKHCPPPSLSRESVLHRLASLPWSAQFEAIKDDDRFVRREVTRILWKHDSERLVNELVKHLDHSNPEWRKAAVWGLLRLSLDRYSHIHSAEIVEILNAHASDRDTDVREAIASSIERLRR